MVDLQSFNCISAMWQPVPFAVHMRVGNGCLTGLTADTEGASNLGVVVGERSALQKE